VRVVAVAGFLGAFTTFSAFSYDTFRLIKDDDLAAGVTNIAANVVLVLVAVVLGVYATKLFKIGT
jgi:CrcB protein